MRIVPPRMQMQWIFTNLQQIIQIQPKNKTKGGVLKERKKNEKGFIKKLEEKHGEIEKQG